MFAPSRLAPAADLQTGVAEPLRRLVVSGAGRLRAALVRLTLGRGSVRRTVLGILVSLLMLTAGAAALTRHHLSYRVHDYAILNLAGQMREMASALALDAALLRRLNPESLSGVEIAGYRERLAYKVAQFDRIVESFESRTFAPDLTGLDAPITCSWDEPSLRQLRATAAVWRGVRHSIAPLLQASASDATVLAGAAVLTTEGDVLLESSRQLSLAFKAMMQRKLDTIIFLQLGVLGATMLAGAFLLAWLQRRVLGPLRAVEHGALCMLDGHLGTSVPVRGDREIAAVGEALNRLSARLRFLFDVADNASAGLTTDELLDSLRSALRPVAQVDLVGVAVRMAGDPGGWRMHRTSGVAGGCLGDRSPISSDRSIDGLTAALTEAAAGQGLASVLVVPVQETQHEAAALVFASREADALPEPTRALLRAVALPVRGQLDRTLSTEALVVAAVEGLAKLAESRDPETGDHLVRMSAYSAMIGAELGSDPAYAGVIDARFVDDLRRFAPMHDIGKVGVEDRILRKPGRLTDDEAAEMARHPAIGAEVLRRCEAQMLARGRSLFRVGIEIAEGHHERWDGTGYPNGLAGEAIPLAARIVAVADVFDALTSKRPYKEAWSVDRALETIDASSGQRFDPAVVAALRRRLPEILAFYERHKHV